MCTLVILRRPGHDWPVLIAANRDEMIDRSWLPPGRHWPDRAQVTAGRDELAAEPGSASTTTVWRPASSTARARSGLRRASARGASWCWTRSTMPMPRPRLVRSPISTARPIDPSTSWSQIRTRRSGCVTMEARRRSSTRCPRVFPCSRRASATTRTRRESVHILRRSNRYSRRIPSGVPGEEWAALLARGTSDSGGDPEAAMCIEPTGGFGTVNASLIALPRPGRPGATPVWRFAPGPPNRHLFENIDI